MASSYFLLFPRKSGETIPSPIFFSNAVVTILSLIARVFKKCVLHTSNFVPPITKKYFREFFLREWLPSVLSAVVTVFTMYCRCWLMLPNFQYKSKSIWRFSAEILKLRFKRLQLQLFFIVLAETTLPFSSWYDNSEFLLVLFSCFRSCLVCFLPRFARFWTGVSFS